MRARRYSLLYPNFYLGEEAIATVHDELYQAPEEFPRELHTSPSIPELNPDEPLSLVYEKKDRPPPNTEHSLSSSTLLSILPNSGDLPEIPDLPLLAFDGSLLSQAQANDDAWTFAETYRRDIGGCDAKTEVTKREPYSALDLFCHLDQVYDPMNVQVQIPKSTPHYVSAQRSPQVDEDVIPAAQKESAKKEASEHLARQAGRDTTKQQPKDEGANGKEKPNEVQAQTQRQKKPAEPAEDKGEKGGNEPQKMKPENPQDAEAKPAPERGAGW